MILDDLITSKDYTFSKQKCHLLIYDNPQGKTGEIKISAGNQLTFVSSDGNSYPFRLDSSEKDIIIDRLNIGFKAVGCAAFYKDIKDLTLFLLDIRLFSTSANMDEMNIYLSDNVLAALEKRHLIRKDEISSDTFYRDFAESFMFECRYSGKCFAFTDGIYSMPESDIPKNFQRPTLPVDADDTAENADKQEALPEKKQQAIVIYGKNCSLYIRDVVSRNEHHLIAEKAVFRKNNLPCMKLGYGTIKFNSENSFVSSTVKKMLEESHGYIELWNNYANMEGEFLLRQARAVGMIYYKGEPAVKGNLLTLFFNNDEKTEKAISLLQPEDFVNYGVEPPYLTDKNMTWEQYCKLPKDSPRNDSNDTKADLPTAMAYKNIVKVISTSSNTITVEWNGGGNMPKNPISLSIMGDEKQIKRRSSARERIERGVSANPKLGLIIDGIVENVEDKKKASNINPLSGYVLDKVFVGRVPTDNQKEAIRIALNTPDIAIIQGPPGTGKTTVIKAIIERLNEISQKASYEAGCVLVTSLQHDAVYNVIKELSINGMPTLKFGSRQKSIGTADTTPEQWETDAENWCSEKAREIREKHPNLTPSAQAEKFRRQRISYLTYPSDEKAAELLKYAESNLSIGENLHKRVEKLLKELTHTDSAASEDKIAYIRRLRVTAEGFDDDGANNAGALYDLLFDNPDFDKNDEENRRILSVLRKAAISETGSKELRKEILEIRNILLSMYLPKPCYSEPAIREDVVELTGDIISSLNDCKGTPEGALLELVNELEENPEHSKLAVQSYSYVFAATAQQSMSQEVLRAKNCSEKNPPQYDTVIVDEAARVPPTDLMIPMSQAKRRIILVGDHRQLPHIYNEDIFEELQDNDKIENHSDIKKSMFQHLIKSAHLLEKSDGIKRVITLSNQYRTHPLLGEFVNNNFYPPEEAFNSPLGKEKFIQPISEKPLIWVDIPVKKGAERKINTSRGRTVEARYISEKLREYLAREDCKELTFGVITFYSAQVQLLREQIGELSKENARRVRIGSVDSFQGLEFDVVFLSTVRTASESVQQEDIDALNNAAENLSSFDSPEEQREDYENLCEKIGMKHYGFLVVKNRLCVALSRQKKLLIVVGDKDIFTREGDYKQLARHCVPAMQNLYKLAEKEGEII